MPPTKRVVAAQMAWRRAWEEGPGQMWLVDKDMRLIRERLRLTGCGKSGLVGGRLSRVRKRGLLKS